MEFLYEGNSLKGGVYKITNKLNGRIYIGSAKEFKNRWKEHARSLEKGKHHNRFLQADYNKCGPEVFSFSILEIIEGDKVARTTAEQKYVNETYDHGDQCYNLHKDTISYQGERKACLEETKKKIGDANRGRVYSPEALENIRAASRNRIGKSNEKVSGEEWRERSPEVYERMVELGKLMAQKNLEKVKAKLTGIPLSDEHRKKLSEAHKGHKPSEETRKKMSEAQRKRKLSEETKKKISEGHKRRREKKMLTCPHSII